MLAALKNNFKSKIIVPTVAILVAFGIILVLYLTAKFSAYSHFLVKERIDANVSSLNFYLKDTAHNTKVASASMALRADVIKAIKKRDKNEIIRIFSPTHEFYQITYYTITDHKGVVLARTHDPKSFGDSVANQRNVKDALAGKASTYFEEGSVVRVSVRTGAPVYDASGALIGVISAGMRLDTDSAVDELQKLFSKYSKDGILIIPNITRSYIGKV